MLTPEKIIDAALEAIDEGGIDGLSLRDVTDRLGVTPPAIYDHFDGKTALLRAAADRFYTELTARLKSQTGSESERAVGGFCDYLDYARKYPRRYGLLLRFPPAEIAEFGHDKLLAWAMAHGLATLFVSRAVSDEDADELIQQGVSVLFGEKFAHACQ